MSEQTNATESFREQAIELRYACLRSGTLARQLDLLTSALTAAHQRGVEEGRSAGWNQALGEAYNQLFERDVNRMKAWALGQLLPYPSAPAPSATPTMHGVPVFVDPSISPATGMMWINNPVTPGCETTMEERARKFLGGDTGQRGSTAALMCAFARAEVTRKCRLALSAHRAVMDDCHDPREAWRHAERELERAEVERAGMAKTVALKSFAETLDARAQEQRTEASSGVQGDPATPTSEAGVGSSSRLPESAPPSALSTESSAVGGSRASAPEQDAHAKAPGLACSAMRRAIAHWDYILIAAEGETKERRLSIRHALKNAMEEIESPPGPDPTES